MHCLLVILRIFSSCRPIDMDSGCIIKGVSLFVLAFPNFFQQRSFKPNDR